MENIQNRSTFLYSYCDLIKVVNPSGIDRVLETIGRLFNYLVYSLASLSSRTNYESHTELDPKRNWSQLVEDLRKTRRYSPERNALREHITNDLSRVVQEQREMVEKLGRSVCWSDIKWRRRLRTQLSRVVEFRNDVTRSLKLADSPELRTAMRRSIRKFNKLLGHALFATLSSRSRASIDALSLKWPAKRISNLLKHRTPRSLDRLFGAIVTKKMLAERYSWMIRNEARDYIMRLKYEEHRPSQTSDSVISALLAHGGYRKPSHFAMIEYVITEEAKIKGLTLPEIHSKISNIEAEITRRANEYIINKYLM